MEIESRKEKEITHTKQTTNRKEEYIRSYRIDWVELGETTTTTTTTS